MGDFFKRPVMVAGRAKGKYRDKLLGLVVYLKVDGEIIHTGASNPKVLALAQDTKE
jgi:hypothetical protein